MEEKYKILIVDDEQSILDMLKLQLEFEGYSVYTAGNAAEALDKLSYSPDIVLLDINMDGMNGLDLCVSIRDFISCPIIFLTARVSEQDKINGLMAGGDDYITKPFGVMELISRVKAMLRRSQKSQEKDKVLKLGNIVLDREKHSVTVGKEPVELTYKEYELLKLLMTNAGIVTTRELILDRVWGTDFEGESRTLDMHIKTLRQKLKEEGSLIKTVRNVGYIMNGEKA